MLGKCIASQCKSTFFNISAASLTSMWFGETEKTIRALFAVAKAHQPSVIFIDEIDSLLRTRGSDESDATRRSKTELLAQIDGMRSEKDDKILVIGATNRPQDLDDAARRRFIKRLYVPLPEQEARIHIAKRLLAKQKHDLNDEDFEKIGTMTNGYSGADMTNLTKEAALGPIRCLDLSKMDDIKKEDVRNVKFTDFEKAFTQIKASVSEQNTKEYEEWNKQYGSTKDSVSASKDHLNMYC